MNDTSLATVDYEWLDSLIEQIRTITVKLAKETFLRYREMGKLILSSGYEKGKWQSEHRQYFLEKLNVTQQTFSWMTTLGAMTEEEFTNAISKFGSFYAWTKRKSLAKQEKRQREIAILKEAIKVIEPPQQKFDVIVVDPPWQLGFDYDPDNWRGAAPYPEMSLEEIKAIQLPHTENCILWLWTTNRFMHDAFHVLEAWGFEPKSILTWKKNKFGNGVWLRGQTEHCILATRGQPTITLTNQSTILEADSHKHSEKPDEFYDLVDSLCSGWKCDYFGRKTREGWTTYGTKELTVMEKSE